MTIVTLLQDDPSHKPFGVREFLEERVLVYHATVQNFHDVVSQTPTVRHDQFVTRYPSWLCCFLFHSYFVCYGIV